MPRNVKTPLFAALACAAGDRAAGASPPTRAARSSGSTCGSSSTCDREAGTARRARRGAGQPRRPRALLVLLAAVAALGLPLGRRREVLAAAVVVAGANLTTQLLKVTLEHARHKAFEHGIELPWPNSFPSGHTTAAASIAVALLLVVPARHRLAARDRPGVVLTAAVGLLGRRPRLALPERRARRPPRGRRLGLRGARLPAPPRRPRPRRQHPGAPPAAPPRRLDRRSPLYSSRAQSAPEWRNWHTRSTQNRLPLRA